MFDEDAQVFDEDMCTTDTVAPAMDTQAFPFAEAAAAAAVLDEAAFAVVETATCCGIAAAVLNYEWPISV